VEGADNRGTKGITSAGKTKGYKPNPGPLMHSFIHYQCFWQHSHKCLQSKQLSISNWQSLHVWGGGGGQGEHCFQLAGAWKPDPGLYKVGIIHAEEYASVHIIYMYSLEDVVYFIWSSVREKDQSPKFSVIEIFWTKGLKFVK
jgi:hypothetical protein